ncbi:aspartic peptidase domain-containing protein [Gigaspora margarita]|uniref:Aspartic peptidase domain-containing protein n=1 Tax=Gigaspora margarita TaxID=4874 RepID=A0A8H4AY56_GIGMA|nr:aspartic peptidase domain-containing protein [Gigaspora margarita]
MNTADPFKEYSPNIHNIDRDVPNEVTPSPPTQTFLPPQILSIDTIKTNDTNDTSSFSLIKVEIGSNQSISLNLIPDISSNDIGLCSQLCYYGAVGDCDNRINYFDSKNSTTFEGTFKTKIINYLDNSSASALSGFDYITLGKYTLKNRPLFFLFDEIIGILNNQSAVEGVMGLGFGSQIWNQLASDGYLQVIGITLPNFICPIGSIAFGGIDLRYISNVPQNLPKIHNISTLNGTDYPTIQVNVIWVSLGSFSTEFFTKLGANKTSDGNWIVPNPVDITLDVTTDSGPIIGITITSFLTCNTNNPNNASRTIGIAERSEEFCPIPGHTGMPPVQPQTTVLPKPIPTYPPPQILALNTFSQSNQSQSLEYLFQIQIGSNLSQMLNIMPDTCVNDFGMCSELCYQSTTGSCNNRRHIFDSKNSSSFSPNDSKGSINYLDGSFANGSFGNDFIILDNFGFATKFSFLLFSQINGALQAESNVEGVMGLGLSSQIWDQLASKGYDQAIGIAFPNYPCPVGSIAFGGIDPRFSKNPNQTFSIPTLNDSTYPIIQTIAIWVNNTPLDFPVINAIISTNYNKVSLGNYSTEFFKALGANKTNDGNWVVPNPVNFNFAINKAKHNIEIAERNSFCPISTPTGTPPVQPQTTILPKPIQTFPPPQIIDLNRFKTDNQSSEFLFQVQIGSNASLNIMPDTCVNDIGICSELCYQSTTGSCNNRQHIFDSKNSSSFSQNGTKGSINYLDGSFANGIFGNDFIILDNFGFANKFSFLLFSQINGALQAESAVEGIMGLGLSSQIWSQLASKGYDQAIGFALPNSVCDFGSIAFGGIDSKFSNSSNNVFNIPTLNDSTYPKIEIVTIWVNRTLLDFPVINAILSTNYNKVSLGNYSTEFFKALGAKKVKEGWVVPNPVDISFDLLTDSGQIIQATIPSNLTCIMVQGQCITVFDDSFVPSNSILLGIPFIQVKFYYIIIYN